MDWDGEVARLRDAQDWDAALTGMYINFRSSLLHVANRQRLYVPRRPTGARYAQFANSLNRYGSLLSAFLWLFRTQKPLNYASVLQIHMCGLMSL